MPAYQPVADSLLNSLIRKLGAENSILPTSPNVIFV
jgi:hypothetical protein